MSEHGWVLVLAFPDQSPNFAHGFECGRIWQRMLSAPLADIVEVVVPEVRSAIEAMAMSRGWIEEFKDIGDGWLEVRLRSPRAVGPFG